MKHDKAFAVLTVLVVLVGSLLLAPPASAKARVSSAQGPESSVYAVQARSCKVVGLDVAVWQPEGPGPFPLVVFSHGFHGRNTQSEFLMHALAKAGYLVVAPNHRDAVSFDWKHHVEKEHVDDYSLSELGPGSEQDSEQDSQLDRPLAKADQRGLISTGRKANESFLQPQNWSESTCRDRRDDVTKLISALHRDTSFDALVNWNKIALVGHSLGGYTVLGLAGAWPSWKVPEVKAVVALSPYCRPFLTGNNLSSLGIPVMYQVGTRDFGITPSVKKPNGAYAKTGSPSYLVEIDKMGHWGWSNLNHNIAKQELIDKYCLAFLNKYLNGVDNAELKTKLPGVSELRSK